MHDLIQAVGVVVISLLGVASLSVILRITPERIAEARRRGHSFTNWKPRD